MGLFSLFQLFMDLALAGISLALGLGFVALIASVLCSLAFLRNAKSVS